MNDIWNFIRTSSNRIYDIRANRGTSVVEPNAEADGNNSSNELLAYVSTPCIHVSESKWDELQSEVIRPKESILSGIVALNPTFALPGYVPWSVFCCGYDDQSEYGPINLDMLATMKSVPYEQWMKAKLRPDSAFILQHACQASQILEKLEVRSSRLVRISFHYYFLDDSFVAYLIYACPNLTTLNLDNSIGLSVRAYKGLGLLANLAHLSLSAVDISEAALARILEGCKRLESLDVSGNCLLTG